MSVANTGLAAADQSANRHFSNGKALADVGAALRNCAKRIADTVRDSEQRYSQFFMALAIATDAYYSATREFLNAALLVPKDRYDDYLGVYVAAANLTLQSTAQMKRTNDRETIASAVKIEASIKDLTERYAPAYAAKVYDGIK